MFKHLLSAFGIHIHTWVYHEEEPYEGALVGRDFRECECGALEEYITVGMPGVGIESSWLRVRESDDV